MYDLTLPSYAKINLGLLIKNKRSDGYHEIETLLHQISLNDKIQLRLAHDTDDIVFFSDNKLIPNDSNNLCVKAASVLKQHHSTTTGVHIYLEKRIPVGAGLGGGSSNAAVVLLGLNKLWGIRLNTDQLKEIASELGSDVPFFIEGGTALATGRGEHLAAVCLSNPFHILVVYPDINISTAWAYNQVKLDLTRTTKSVRLAYFNNLDLSKSKSLSSLINQFESVILSSYPVIGQIKKQMQEARAVYTSLSGSGSAVFGMFRHLEDAMKIKEELGGAYQCFLTNHIHWGYGQM